MISTCLQVDNLACKKSSVASFPLKIPSDQQQENLRTGFFSDQHCRFRDTQVFCKIFVIKIYIGIRGGGGGGGGGIKDKNPDAVSGGKFSLSSPDSLV